MYLQLHVSLTGALSYYNLTTCQFRETQFKRHIFGEGLYIGNACCPIHAVTFINIIKHIQIEIEIHLIA